MADINCEQVLGPAAVGAMRRAGDFLAERTTPDLLAAVGRTFPELAMTAGMPDKHSFPVSYGGGKPCDDDLLAAAGMFYVTQAGKLMLDCTSGHYQMTWGYNHPALTAAAIEAMQLGVIWDNHSNIPGLPVKLLADRLTALGAPMGLDRVLLGVCTGSVACSTALKVMLMRYGRDPERAALGPPLMVALAGNYHGTDMVAQTMRGMWPGLVSGMDTIEVEPNDGRALRAAFERFGRRVAGFWAEPVMMNREALLVDPEYLALARDLCDDSGALMAIDEIQTGFWYPEVLMTCGLGVSPDFVIIGKGMTAGFHPLSGVLYRAELDILQQYDSISTNGGASLAAFVGLCNLRLLDEQAARLAQLLDTHVAGLRALQSEFPNLIEAVNGQGFLTGLKFTGREDAIGFHRAAVARGLWLRVHAYHPGHRTVLMKYPLVVDEAVMEYVLSEVQELLRTTPWRG
jgi:acetylornithine/succinyldiaminopimelate/putrescine aminotransferase